MTLTNPPVDLPEVYHDGTQVFNGVCPIASTDLNLSGNIGANRAMLLLRIQNLSGDATALQFETTPNDGRGYHVGVNNTIPVAIPDQSHTMLVTWADVNGIIEWKASAAKNAQIILMWYFRDRR